MRCVPAGAACGYGPQAPPYKRHNQITPRWVVEHTKTKGRLTTLRSKQGRIRLEPKEGRDVLGRSEDDNRREQPLDRPCWDELLTAGTQIHARHSAQTEQDA